MQVMGRADLHARGWAEVRLTVLNRDGWLCQVKLPGCRGRATTAHHLDDVALYGPSLDVDRLAASCTHCNCSLGGRLGRRLQLMRSRSSRPW